MMSGLSAKVVLVTGSSRGIGAAIARAFARHGAKVAVHGRDADAFSLRTATSSEKVASPFRCWAMLRSLMRSRRCVIGLKKRLGQSTFLSLTQEAASRCPGQ